MTLVAGIAIANSELTLRDIAAQLERMHERTPRGGRQWQPSSVKALLDRARRLGLVTPDPAPGGMRRPGSRPLAHRLGRTESIIS